MANEEVIGYHKGALATLSKERQELVKMINIVDQFIKMHLEELKKLGIDLEKEAEKVQRKQESNQQNKQQDYNYDYDYQDTNRLA